MEFLKKLFGFGEKASSPKNLKAEQQPAAKATEKQTELPKIGELDQPQSEQLPTLPNLVFTDVQAYTHQGKREYQEDSYHIGQHFLIVSDGMGGHAKGDVASQIVVKTFSEAMQQRNKELILNNEQVQAHLQTTVQFTVDALNDYATKEPAAYKMGATLVLALITNNKLYLAHIGDSRIYLFGADGEIKFVSKDHSQVQELIDLEIITPEEARTHPRRNVITRVLQAKEGLKTKATINIIENIAPTDKLLLCSDGVLESWDDNGLSVIFSLPLDNLQTIEELKKHCSKHSSDNNTAIVANLFPLENTPKVAENKQEENEEKQTATPVLNESSDK